MAYLVVLFAMRLIGRRTASHQAPFDMVVLFLFGGMTTTAMDGRCSEGQMHNLRMQEADIRTAIRQQGIIEMDDMRYAIIECDGTISIIPQEKK